MNVSAETIKFYDEHYEISNTSTKSGDYPSINKIIGNYRKNKSGGNQNNFSRNYSNNKSNNCCSNYTSYIPLVQYELFQSSQIYSPAF
jgi:hypothetical protein